MKRSVTIQSLCVYLLAVVAFAAFTTHAHATELPVAADAYVNSTRNTTNFGYQSNLYIGDGNTTFLQFDLSGLPSGITSSQISAAKVTVFVNRVNTAGTVSVAAVTSGWGESAVTYQTMPSVSGSATTTFTPGASGTYVTFDITALVQGWVTTPSGNYGIALSSASGNLLLDTKENDQTGHAASLNVTVTSVGATGPQGIQGPPGANGANGTNGTDGAQGPPGPAGTIGAVTNYSSTATYSSGQVVYCQASGACNTSGQGSSYVSLISNNTGHDPYSTNGTDWQQIAAAGLNGTNGTNGAAGATGAAGPAGTAGGQIWSSNIVMPSSVNSYAQYVFPASGFGSPVLFPNGVNLTQRPGAVQQVALGVPLACSANNYQVQVMGAASGARANLYLAVSSDLTNDNPIFSTSGTLNSQADCTVTVGSNGIGTCTAPNSFGVGSGTFVLHYLQITNSSGGPPVQSDANNWANARLYVRFTCQ